MNVYIFQILLWIDQGVNVLLGGWADETLSARAWRQRHKKRWKVAVRVIDAMFFWQTQHCQLAYLAELQRFQLPPQYRDAASLKSVTTERE